jgi:DNA invertase Pin-like site-specific DNA recombinase
MRMPHAEGSDGAGSAFGFGMLEAMKLERFGAEDAATMERLNRQCREWREEGRARVHCGNLPGLAKMDEGRIAEAHRMRARGYTLKRIASFFDVHHSTISRLFRKPGTAAKIGRPKRAA